MRKVAAADLRSYLKTVAERVEQTLDQLLPGENEFPEIINKAMRYSTLGGGKRLRAFLALEACNVVGGNIDQALPLGAAIEMIHAYSLIHDDLPSMDNDDYRRGKPSNHIVFGEGIAVLAGDGLLTEAFNVLARLSETNGISSEVALKIVEEIAIACGSRGLIGGQTADINSSGNNDPELLEYIHQKKTGALFEASLICGGMVGGAKKEELEALKTYGRHFGAAFQITDDILDVIGETTKLGKTVGSDQGLDKLTFPKVYGLDKSKQMAKEHVELGIESLTIFGDKAMFLKLLASYILKRDM